MAFPKLNVMLDTNNTCNLSCKMCYFSIPGAKTNHVLPLENFKKLADVFARQAISFSLSCGTEPLMTKNFLEYLRIAQDRKIPNVWFVTNALLLTPEISETIIKSKIKFVVISLDGAVKETYESVRRGASFEKLLENINQLAALKRRYNSKLPLLFFNYVLMKSNVRELKDFVELVSGWDAHKIGVYFFKKHEGVDIDSERVSMDQAGAVLKEARLAARKKGILMTGPVVKSLSGIEKISYGFFALRKFIESKGLRYAFFEIKRRLTGKKYGCLYLGYSLNIDGVGNVRPCPYWCHDDPIGNIYEKDLKEIWYGRKNQEIQHMKRDKREACFLSCQKCENKI